MAATIKELLWVIAGTYCLGALILGVILYFLILVRLIDYYIYCKKHKEEDHEL